MADFIMARPGTSLIGDFLWQSTLFLVVGLAASAALRRRPARAHVVLLLAIFGSLVTPLVQPVCLSCGLGAGERRGK